MGNEDTGWDDEPGYGLAEAQIAAIEEAFAERDRLIAGLRREVEALRNELAEPRDDAAPGSDLGARLGIVEARLEQQEQALRHVLERLIAFFGQASGDAG